METLREMRNGQQFSVPKIFTVLETYLIVGDVVRERGEKVLKDLQELAQGQSDTNQVIRAKEIWSMKTRIDGRGDFSIQSVANKVDLAFKLGDGY
jgi:hypothetical protein